MAASSGGVEWSSIIKTFLSSDFGKGNKADVLELCFAIVKNEGEILRYRESNKSFYNSFVILAVSLIVNNVDKLTVNQIEVVSSACRVLLKYLLTVLQGISRENNPNSVLAKQCLKAIKALCLGTEFLSSDEVTVLTDTMKGDTVTGNSPSGTEKEVTNKQDNSKSRTDLSISIFEQLTRPLQDGHAIVTTSEPSSSQPNVTESATSTDPTTEINKLFLMANTENLQSLRAGDTLADLCLSLPAIKRARTKVEEALAGKPFSLPSTLSEASIMRSSLPSTMADISLASSALNLPVLEPLSPSKLDKLCSLSMAVLQCTVAQAVANAMFSLGPAISPKCTSAQGQTPKDDDLDANAVALVEEALNIFTHIGNTIKNSTRAGGHVYQNHLLAGAWVLLSGLQSHLATCMNNASEKSTHSKEREEKGRSPSKTREGGSSRSSLLKFQQSFGVLSVALATKAMSLLTELFEDLYLEVCGGGCNNLQVEPAPLAIMGQFSALQRVARLLSVAPLNQLLFYLATVSYRKACTLKRIHPPEGDTFSQSDSTTYYEDMIMCSDDSSTEDDDSEPILGQWFEATLAPPDTSETSKQTNENKDNKNGGVLGNQHVNRNHSIVPEKGEAHGYISLATQIFVFLNRHFICSKSTYVTRYVKGGLSEQQMVILAAIIKDLDKETARTEVGTISVYFGAALGQLYSEFSGALTRFTHNLITHIGLQHLQTSLLTHLGISPWNTDVPHSWPLQVYSRSLAVLAQILLLRPQNEKEASVISIWHRVVNTLIENVINPPPMLETDNEDINVEHAQVLLYLFHSLNLMQKKSVVLLMAGGVLRCSEVASGPLRDFQLLHLSRLLLLFDYIMKHLYDASTVLLEQIHWNLFYSTNLNTDKDKENNMARMFAPWKEIEDNYRKIAGNDEFSMKPCFYMLTNVEISNQDAPKLDGLACNFILGTPDKLRYPLLLDALIEILNVTHITAGTGASKLTFLGLCATHYCFAICWRLLQLLPPSTANLERLSTGEILPPGPLLIHSLIWGPRTGHKNFNRWLKDALVKQGLYTVVAEKLLKSVSDIVNTLKYDVITAKSCIIALTPDVKKGSVSKENLPPLWHLFILDSVLAKVQISLIDEVETNTADASGVTISGAAYVQELLPHVLRLTQAILHCTRWALLHSMDQQNESSVQYTLQDFESLQEVLAIASSQNTLTSALATELSSLLPSSVIAVLKQWNSSTLEDCTWTPYLNDVIPSESYILKIIEIHTSSLSLSYPFNVNYSLKRLLQCLMKFICQHAAKIDNTDTKNKAIELLVLVTLDVRTEFLHESVSKTLDKMIGDTETDEHQKRVYLHFLEHSYKLITRCTQQAQEANNVVDEKILHRCLKFYEKLLEKSSGRQALETFFSGDRDLVKVLMSVNSPSISQQYSTKVLNFFNKLFQAAEKSSTDPSLNYLCSSMCKLAEVDGDKLQVWLRHVILGPSNMETSTSSSLIQTPTLVPTKISDTQKPTTSTTKTEISTSLLWGAGNSNAALASIESNISPIPSDDQKSLVQENSQLLQALTSFIVKQSNSMSEDVALTILKALLPLGSHILSSALEGVGFTDLMVVMTTLADAGSGKGHAHLFPATAEWLDICRQFFKKKEVIEKLEEAGGVGLPVAETNKNTIMLDAACCLMDYVGDVVSGLASKIQGSTNRPLSPPWESEMPLDLDSEWQDETNETEDSGDDSDEDSLCNKLCTFTVTQKEFMNQHWYHCHTCRMLDGVGVCSVCARVCHKGHDLSYAKYGNFFCDCGAKEDGSCQALVKRSPHSNENAAAGGPTSSNSVNYIADQLISNSIRRNTSSPVLKIDKNVHSQKDKKRNTVGSVKKLEGVKEWLHNFLGNSSIPGVLLELVESLIPVVEKCCAKSSAVGCHSRALKAVQQLHSAEKKYVYTDQLMVPTLGSQEGAFENVRMSYSGEQGQTIRQLLSAHIIRRVAMCCMSSIHGRRQHLAVSHEKGKITVLQLSSLLKQADSSTRKLTLTRLASAPIPFTVLSLSSNQCNEDYLAVCGLKDCHILTFTSSGSVSDHLVLHPQLETGNFIIKAVWLPGSQTKLALVTADFVKIYDLSKDALSPHYYFLVPTGKVRDCTFVYEDDVYNILIMSSPGHIYREVLNEESSAKHGSFYVTNTLEVFHLDVTDVNGQVAGGGVSIYYSHTLGLLFYSYAQGKNFISRFKPKSNCLSVVFPITLSSQNSASSKSNGSKNITPQPLCQWTEIPNHPGLICAVMQSSNNPVIIMLKPDAIAIQEIKIVPSKSKIMDVVAIRHVSGNDQRTTLILLCEDGSLKIYMANMDQTDFWMSSNIQPALPLPSVKPRKKKVVKAGKSSGTVSFPVDFFEHCQPINDVEIGGNDLLQVYNASQLKHRLNVSGLYVVCTKPLGFTIEITNPDNSIVMTGVRIAVGGQDPQRAPSFIEVYGRIVTISCTRARWYDIPFSREESLQSDKKLSIMFGPSQDPETVTMVDSIKIYGKTKEVFGWPEENDESATNNTTAPQSVVVSSNNEVEQLKIPVPLTNLERIVVSILEVLENSFALCSVEGTMAIYKPLSLKITTALLTLPSSPLLQIHSKALLSTLYPTKQAYHNYKDLVMIQHVLIGLVQMIETDPKNYRDIDPENYYRLIMLVRSIAVYRPNNLVKYFDLQKYTSGVPLEDPLDVKIPPTNISKSKHLLLKLMDVLWILHSQRVENIFLTPLVCPGLKHVEQTVHAIVEIVHAFHGSSDPHSFTNDMVVNVYLQLLLCENSVIAFSAKQALSKVLKPKTKRRKVHVPSSPNCPPHLKVGGSETEGRKKSRKITSAHSSQEDESHSQQPARYEVDAVESIGLLQQGSANQDNHNLNALEALLGGGVGFPPLIDIPPDADDEAMVELAIALSLQDHELGGEMQQNQQELRTLQVSGGGGGQAQEMGHFSDTTASAAGSDDEGSTAATDGSTLRTSPAEQGGSVESESGGSGVESITGEQNASGRSSAYGDNIQEASNSISRSDTTTLPLTNVNIQNAESEVAPIETENEPEQDSEVCSHLHLLRLQLLERLVEYLPKLRDLGGVRVIPFLQVVLQLTSELHSHMERDKICLNTLLAAIINELQINTPDFVNVSERNKKREVQMVLMRLLSVMMSRCKTTSTTPSASSSKVTSSSDNSTFVSQVTATALYKADIINYCLKLLQSLLEYWRNASTDDEPPQIGGNLLKENLPQSPPDMTPFFLKQFVKGHSTDVFQTYPQLLTEMALRLPYQVHKHSDVSEPINIAFENAWYTHLCEYMMTSQEPFVRRQVRKLLLFICGNKEKYRLLRDVHALNTHIKEVKKCCLKGGYESKNETQHALSMTYNTLVDLMEHLKACLEVAINRTGNWQKFCIHHDDILPFLFQVGCILDENVAPTILQLLQCAIVTNAAVGTQASSKKTESKTSGSVPSRKDREKSDDSSAEAVFEEANCGVLVEQINKEISPEVLARFVRAFLLETNASYMRWQAHGLILAIYKNSKTNEQEQLLKLLWHLWPMLPVYGRKATQFVDLLGYFSLCILQKSESSSVVSDYVEKAVGVLRMQNKLLAHHPNANLYMQMSQFVELDGYYLESEPCLVCNNPEVPYTSIKLSSLKVDSKFTTTTQIVKLVNSHTISKITLRIGDLKRTKMVRTINIYYNNRSVQAVVELKNKPALWHKAKKVVLQSGQTEVKIEFPLPIIACNLMIEYSDFYENIQASSETLQCPRCSAAVPTNPGVCSNCGENVFQCHKCRAINYDEKDPFLCHACGFCKYAKFDFTLVGKPCCAVEPIETDEDRKKMITSINNLLEKADRVYKQLVANKPALESLVLKITDHRSEKQEEQSTSNNANNAAVVQSTGIQVKVNKGIQMLAQQYCSECKTSFEELSKIIQKVLVSRKELVTYDRRHMEMDSPVSQTPLLGNQTDSQNAPPTCSKTTRCYGCSSAANEHCLTLLRALATNSNTKQVLCSKGLIQELVQNNLRKGSVQMQEEVRQLLCILTRDNAPATEQLCNLLTERITLSLQGHTSCFDLGTSVRHEIELLSAMVQKEDNCWELKLRCLMKLFVKACKDSRNPLVMESIILPCLKILKSLIKNTDSDGTARKSKEKVNKPLMMKTNYGVNVDVYKWLNKDPLYSYSNWKARTSLKIDEGPRGLPSSREEVRMYYLAEKYGRRWKRKVFKEKPKRIIQLDYSSWLKIVLFNPSSRLARQVTCSIIENMCISFERKREILILLTYFLDQLSSAGESSAEFLTLYQSLIQEEPWKQFLTLIGLLEVLAHLITKEIEQLHILEETTLTSDLTQGYSLNQLTELLSSFLDDACIRRQYKGRLVGAVLNGYLSLRRLVVQRTRLTDDTQEKLLELLEEMTTGTEEETKAFMAICIETVENCKLQDVLTPVFIFERLCSIIYPEDNDVGEFFLTLDKDPQQEDFLQGRMLGNPYSSLEPGLGPLMRDVKNKICQDCELVALLEDDNGMELLVNNKIMSLDLPVKDVYKKVWLAEGGEAESMRVIYRMRGLLGDATEEFVETLNNKSQTTVDNEEVFKMANVLAECGGLKVMVKRLNTIQNIRRARPLLQVLLKLFRLCVKVEKVQEVLIDPQLEAAGVFLRTLQHCLASESDSNQTALTEQLLEIMETIFSKATSKSKESFDEFARTLGGPEYVQSLLSFTSHSSVRNNQPVLLHLTRVLAALVYGNEEKMRTLVAHFNSVFRFYDFDSNHRPEDQHKFEMFCMLTDGIERNAVGNTLRDFINSIGVVEDALHYIISNAPCVKPTLLRTDSDELKEFISKPSLKYILRFLTGLASGHENTQLAIAAADTIPIIHRLEQVSSDEHVGSLAENLLEALRANPSVASRIEDARDFTRSEKKRLAMAMREKQLGQLGMRTNDKGQVTAKSSILQQIEELGEETGLVCCICREGYKYQPSKVLGIYTFTKRCNVEEFEAKPRKTMGYNTVTHFNIVHVDCHMSAVRLARVRDEWESAALQNANTKCNGLLPLWGPQVPESAFASCLARHNTYLQESTNHRDIGHVSTIHDLKLLLLRFAFEKPFHEDTGGGGPQSNMHLVPYMMHMALYVINTTRSAKKEEQSLMSYLENQNKDKWLESSYDAEGPLFWMTMSLCLQSKEKWTSLRLIHMKRLLILAQTRHCSPSGLNKSLFEKTLKQYASYKPYLIFFGLVDGIYSNFFKNLSCADEQWPTKVADYIRYNDEVLLKASERLLSTYIDELLPCTSFSEFCDVADLLSDIPDPDAFITNLFKEF